MRKARLPLPNNLSEWQVIFKLSVSHKLRRSACGGPMNRYASLVRESSESQREGVRRKRLTVNDSRSRPQIAHRSVKRLPGFQGRVVWTLIPIELIFSVKARSPKTCGSPSESHTSNL